jgi:uncharacterized protein YbjT (DUF2867 family)
MNTTTKPVLVLGGSGKTGTRVAGKLRDLQVPVRTAARSGTDVRFDWDDRSTYGAALAGADRVYLVAPTMRVDFAPQVSDFLDLAEDAGVGHVTFLSAYGIDQASPEVAIRAVELNLIGRTGLAHALIRPAWFMQNFSETFLLPLDDRIVVPTGGGAEAFVDVDDIASVAAATLARPDLHAGAQYAPTGPESLTVAEAAEHISAVTGRPIEHSDIDRDLWIEAITQSGVPPEYGAMLRMLTETVAAGHGAQPNLDVQAVTGRLPIRFADYAARTAQSWA